MSLKVVILAFAVVKGCLASGLSHSKSMILYLRNEIKKNELNSLGFSMVAVGKKADTEIQSLKARGVRSLMRGMGSFRQLTFNSSDFSGSPYV